ncbi:MAG: CoA transferase [Actinomycetota bacterium]|nr:CoA transferase [Actinomycetota bacterium]
MTAGPLEGIRILDLTRLLPGGYATLLMADLGADVVKVEEPGKGDYIRWTPPLVGEFSTGHIALNRNKRSITLNLKIDRGREIFRSLAANSEVVIESFRPGVMARLGLGWDDLRKINPALVYCAISGYGQDGPRAQEAGHDVNYMGRAGALSIMGEESGRPVIPGLQIGDLAGGGMAAVIAVLTALLRRATTGEGDFCDVSMTDGVFSWLSIHASEFFATGVDPQRERMHLSGLYPCYRIYPAADGWLSVGALEPQFWAQVCDVLDRPDLAGDAYATGERRGHVIAELNKAFSTKTRAEWMDSFQGLDACVAPVNGFTEAFADPQALHRGMIVDGEVPGAGPFKFLGSPIKLQNAPSDVLRRPPPQMGEHTEEVLAEVGVDSGAIGGLRSEGVL